MIVLLFSSFAAAGYYHPADIAAASKTYSTAADQASAHYEEANRTAEALALAFTEYELSLDLLGAAAPAAERERLDTLRKTYNRERAQLESFASYMMEDFDSVFLGAMDRAVASHKGAQECEAMVQKGPSMPGIRPRFEKNPDCTGEDLNALIADAMDRDATLAAAVKEILTVDWPGLTSGAEAMAPVGGGDRWVSVSALVKKGAPSALAMIDREDDSARTPLAAAIEEGATTEEKAALVSQARQITAATAAKRAAMAGPVLTAADAAAAKWAKKGEPATGWCANPELLGGCSGTNATGELVPRLLADKKVGKALP